MIPLRALFPLVVGACELSAAIVYACGREWRLAGIWACYAVSAALLSGVK